MSRQSAVDRIAERGYRTVNIKTTALDLIPDLSSAFSLDGGMCAYCVHHQDGFVDHVHLVARFNSPRHYARLVRRLAEVDPCFYWKPCRTFRASYRYLAHLDNPEKHRVDIRDIVRCGDWDGIPLIDWHLARKFNMTLDELCDCGRDYLLQCRADHCDPSLIGFALWLDSHGYNARSALSGLSVMGICIESFFSFAHSRILQPPTETQETTDDTID